MAGVEWTPSVCSILKDLCFEKIVPIRIKKYSPVAALVYAPSKDAYIISYLYQYKIEKNIFVFIN